MEYKSFKQFYWKSAIFRIGLPWGFFTGVVLVILQDREILNYFLRTEIIAELLFFILIGGLLMAYGAGKSIWNRSKKSKSN